MDEHNNLTWDDARLRILHSGLKIGRKILWNLSYLYSELKSYGFTKRPYQLCKSLASPLEAVHCAVHADDVRFATGPRPNCMSTKAALAYLITQYTVKQCNNDRIKSACLCWLRQATVIALNELRSPATLTVQPGLVLHVLPTGIVSDIAGVINALSDKCAPDLRHITINAGSAVMCVDLVNYTTQRLKGAASFMSVADGVLLQCLAGCLRTLGRQLIIHRFGDGGPDLRQRDRT